MAVLHREETVYQMAFVVEDLETGAVDWARRGAGPFYRFDDFQFSEMLYPEGASSPRLSILLGYSGDTMIELIEVQEDSTGLFHVPRTPAPHHVAMLVHDIESYLEKRECRHKLALHGVFPTGTPVAMLDTRETMGLLTELVTLDDSALGLISLMREESASFNGERLLRSFE